MMCVSGLGTEEEEESSFLPRLSRSVGKTNLSAGIEKHVLSATAVSFVVMSDLENGQGQNVWSLEDILVMRVRIKERIII